MRLTWTHHRIKKVTIRGEVETKVDVFLTEEGGVDATATNKTRVTDKERINPKWCAIDVTKQGIIRSTVPVGYLSSKKRMRMMMQIHKKLIMMHEVVYLNEENTKQV